MIKLYSESFTTTYVDTAGYNVPNDWDLTFLIILPDAVSCKVTEERNGKYELELVYAANGLQRDSRNYWLAVDKILEVDCPLRDSIGQNLFRIYRVANGLDGLIYVYARQISTDLSYYVANNSGSPVTGGITVFADSGGAHGYGYNLRVIANDDLPFAFGGDAEYDTSITGVGFQQDWSSCSSIRSYLGGEELTGYDRNALQRFGGEYEFDRFNVNLWEERGQTRPVTITYGTNLADINADDDVDSVYTAVVAFAVVTDGINYTKYCSTVVDTPYVSLFPYRRIKTIDVSAELMEQYPNGVPSTISGWLYEQASAYVAAHGNEGNPLRKVTVDVVESELNDVYLCDTVKVVYHKDKLSINADMKITAYEWDVLRQRYTSLTLGPIQTSLAKEIIDAGEKSDIIALQNVAASTQNAIQELQARYVLKAGDTMTGALEMDNSNIIVENDDLSSSTYGNALAFRNLAESTTENIGYLRSYFNSLTQRGLQLETRRTVNGSSVYNNVLLTIDSSGTRAVSVTSPSAWKAGLHVVFTTQEFTLSSLTMAANSTTSKSISIAKTGYTPLGIVGHANAGSTGFYAYQTKISGTTVTGYFRNITSSQISGASYTFVVLYIQT